MLLLQGLAVSWLALAVYTAWMLTHPPRRTRGWAVARSLPSEPSELTPSRTFENVDRLMLAGVRCAAWYVDGACPTGPVVIVSHGWGESRVHGLARLEPIAAAASRIILWDMVGHGESAGRCGLGRSEPRLLGALIDTVAGRDGRVVLYGSSLGAGVSIAAAAEDQRVAAVIAEAPYRLPQTPAGNVLRLRGLPDLGTLRSALAMIGGFRWLRLGGGFDRATMASRLNVPLLVIHGEADEVCPLADGAAIAEAAPKGTLTAIAGGAHLDLWTSDALRPIAAGAVRDFLQSLAASPAIGQPTGSSSMPI